MMQHENAERTNRLSTDLTKVKFNSIITRNLMPDRHILATGDQVCEFTIVALNGVCLSDLRGFNV